MLGEKYIYILSKLLTFKKETCFLYNVYYAINYLKLIHIMLTFIGFYISQVLTFFRLDTCLQKRLKFTEMDSLFSFHVVYR